MFGWDKICMKMLVVIISRKEDGDRADIVLRRAKVSHPNFAAVYGYPFPRETDSIIRRSSDPTAIAKRWVSFDALFAEVMTLISRRVLSLEQMASQNGRRLLGSDASDGLESAACSGHLRCWLPPRDSNPDMLIQSQLSYH